MPTSGGKPVGVDEKRMAEIAPTSGGADPRRRRQGVGAAKSAGPVIDGIFVRGLYLFNPKQQEVVVDYFRNLVGSPYFAIDPNNQARVIKPTTPNNTDWAFPYELASRFEEAGEIAMNWFQQNRWLGTFLIALGVVLRSGAAFSSSTPRSSSDDALARFNEAAAERNRLERLDPFPNDANYKKMKVHLENYGVAV